jgi:hypothetical protein
MINADGRRIPIALSAEYVDLYPGERFDILIKSQSLLDSFVNVSYFDLRNDNLLGSNSVPIKIGGAEIQPHNFNLLHFWPNPIDGILNYSNSTSEEITYKIISLDGTILQAGNLQPGKQSLTLEFATGIYFLKTPQATFTFTIR